MPAIEEAFINKLVSDEESKRMALINEFNSLLAAFVTEQLEDIHANGKMFTVHMVPVLVSFKKFFFFERVRRTEPTIEQRVLFEIKHVAHQDRQRLFVSGYSELFLADGYADPFGSDLVPFRVMMEDIEERDLLNGAFWALKDPALAMSDSTLDQ